MRRTLLFLTATLLMLAFASCSSRKTAKPVVYKPAVVRVNKADYLDNNPCKLDKEQRALIEESLTWLGTPYRYAADVKGEGTDCSGMMLRLYMDILGKPLPRNSAKQAEVCDEVKKEDLRPGDLVFFATGRDPKRISHVGMMLTAEEFIHASSSKGVVINSLYTPYYTRTYIFGGRVKR